MSNLSQRIRHIRKKEGLSQIEFAEKIGVNQGHISKIETDKAQPSQNLLIKICIEFGISFDWISKGIGRLTNFEWGEEQLRSLLKSDNIDANFKDLFILYENVALKELERYNKIADYLGTDIFQLIDLSSKSGDDISKEILRSIENKLLVKASKKGIELLDHLNDIEKSVIQILRNIDPSLLKDFYLFLASKADRLEKEQKERLKNEIKILKKASR
jgi:transcriptional regulator with XRE-family HTH domain